MRTPEPTTIRPAELNEEPAFPPLAPEVERRIVAMMRAELPKAAARLAEREAAEREHVRAA